MNARKTELNLCSGNIRQMDLLFKMKLFLDYFTWFHVEPKCDMAFGDLGLVGLVSNKLLQ